MEIDSIRLIRSKKNKFANKAGKQKCKYIFGVGASEGGYGSLLKIIPFLHPELPIAFIIIIHAESRYVDAFARYLDANSLFNVKRAADGDTVEAGVCYIAAGEEHVSVDSGMGSYALRVNKSELPKHKGSINLLMYSLAQALKERSIGVVLTGSGNDGTDGVHAISTVGGAVIVQKPESCLCREMSISVIAQCNVNMVIADNKLADKLNRSFL